MEFLEYLRSWKESTKNRPGNFSQNARAHMFLSWQTYKGFQSHGGGRVLVPYMMGGFQHFFLA